MTEKIFWKKKEKKSWQKKTNYNEGSISETTDRYVLCLYYQIYDLTWSISLECTTLPKLILIEGFL